MPELVADLCVIGAGSAGLSVAAGAAQMGARTVLVERGRMGGECLNEGCVPSKALIAAARQAEAIRKAGRFGLHPGELSVDFAAVQDHVRSVIAALAPHDSAARFEGLGVTVLPETGRFLDGRCLQAGRHVVRARRFVIATGSAAAIPPIAGLDAVPYLTNHSIFDLRRRPDHLLTIGGGPVGVELAQAFRRLGSRVTILEQASLLARDDPELVAVIRDRLKADGVAVHEQVRIAAVAAGPDGGIALQIEGPGAPATIAGSALLVAAGRRPVIDGLDLERAGVAVTGRGITVDARLRTTNRRIYALGDVIGGPQFTHMAAWQAGIVLRNALFRLPARARPGAWPRVTYSAPELAQAGLTAAEAEARHGRLRVLRWPFSANDRAVIEGDTQGLVKIVTTRRGRILGAGIAGPQAGELILPWVLAMNRGLGIASMAGLIAPYPTLGEMARRVAGEYYAPVLFGPRTRRLVRLLQRLG